MNSEPEYNPSAMMSGNVSTSLMDVMQKFLDDGFLVHPSRPIMVTLHRLDMLDEGAQVIGHDHLYRYDSVVMLVDTETGIVGSKYCFTGSIRQIASRAVSLIL